MWIGEGRLEEGRGECNEGREGGMERRTRVGEGRLEEDGRKCDEGKEEGKERSM